MVTGSELIGEGYVLESPTHGPQFCLGGLLMSLPPQGSGPVILNWDWAVTSGFTCLNGTTWGAYTLIGSYDGHSFTITRPPRRPRLASTTDADEERERDRLRTPAPGAPMRSSSACEMN